MPAPDVPVSLFAYGPVPGVELIPYFLALLTWIALALGAIFLSPITAIVRRLRRIRGGPPAEPKSEPVQTPLQAPLATPPSPLTSEPHVEGPRNNG